MKKRLSIVFIISFISISLILILFNKYEKRPIAVQDEEPPIASQEYRTDEETANLFVDSYMRNYFMLINDPNGDFTYMKPMLAESIEEKVINDIKELREEKVKVDYNFEIKSIKNDNDTYDYILNVYGTKIKDGEETKENYNVELKIKKVEDRLKVVYENRV